MHKLFLPRLGQTMEEGLLSDWLVAEGSAYDAGQSLYEVETEKVNTEVEATLPGTLVRILVKPSSTIPVGTLVAVAADPGESPSAAQVDAFVNGDVAPAAEAATTAPSAPSAAAPETAPATSGPVVAAAGPVRAYPRTRKLARDLGVELTGLDGTGVDGLVTEADVRAAAAPATESAPAPESAAVPSGSAAAPAAAAPPAAPATPAPATLTAAAPSPAPERVALPVGVRQRERRMLGQVARRMSQITARSWSEVPQFTQTVTVDASGWKARRETLREQTGLDIGYTDMILDAMVKAVQEVPEANSSFDGDALVLWGDINVSVAVDSPQGLVVPVLRAAQDYSIAGRANRMRELVERARTGQLTLDDVSGGTITVSNLGMYGIEGGAPMVTAPQSSIVFVGAMREVVTAVDGAIAIRPVVTLANSFDHRALDGATAARFTAALRKLLEGERS